MYSRWGMWLVSAQQTVSEEEGGPLLPVLSQELGFHRQSQLHFCLASHQRGVAGAITYSHMHAGHVCLSEPFSRALMKDSKRG